MSKSWQKKKNTKNQKGGSLILLLRLLLPLQRMKRHGMATEVSGGTEACSVTEVRLLSGPDEHSRWGWTVVWEALQQIIGVLLQSCEFPLVSPSDSCNKKAHRLASRDRPRYWGRPSQGLPTRTLRGPSTAVCGWDWRGAGVAMRRKHTGRIKWPESWIISCKHIWEGASFKICHIEVSDVSW